MQRREAEGLLVVEHFHAYAAGRRFVVRTDHQALVKMAQKQDPTKRIARTLWYLLQYAILWEYLPGENNDIADALSRKYVPTEELLGLYVDVVDDHLADECAGEQEHDSRLRRVKEEVQRDGQGRSKDPAVRQIREACELDAKNVIRKDGKVVVPRHLEEKVLESVFLDEAGEPRTAAAMRRAMVNVHIVNNGKKVREFLVRKRGIRTSGQGR